MNRRQAVDSLELNHHSVRNKQVHAIPTIQSETFVNHRQGPLTHERHSSKRQFVAQTLPISRFQQSWSQLAMHLDRAGTRIAGIGLSAMSVPRTDASRSAFRV